MKNGMMIVWLKIVIKVWLKNIYWKLDEVSVVVVLEINYGLRQLTQYLKTSGNQLRMKELLVINIEPLTHINDKNYLIK